MNDKLLKMLGIAYRAKAVVIGDESVLFALQKEKVKLVFVAKDASSSTIDKFVKKCFFYKVMCNNDYSCEEISKALGRFVKVIAIIDEGISTALKKLMR